MKSNPSYWLQRRKGILVTCVVCYLESSARGKDDQPENASISENVAVTPKDTDVGETELPGTKPAIKSNKPAMAKYSPLDPEILDLMYGKDEVQPEDEAKPECKEDGGKEKKTRFMKK